MPYRSPLDRNAIESWAVQHHVELPIAEKVLWLSRLLRGVMESHLGKDFALMGGSAIVFLYRNMYRLSTDLDLDFVGDCHLGSRGEPEVALRIGKDRRALAAIADNLGMGFRLHGKPKPRFVQYLASYPSLFRRTDAVELDISYRFGHSILGTVSRPWPIQDGASTLLWKVNTLHEEELYACKALAMFDVKKRLDFPGKIGLFTKRKIRHLFDVYLLAREVLEKKSKINLCLFRDVFVLLGMTRIENFEYFRGNSIGFYTDVDVMSELMPVVPRAYPVPTAEEMKWVVRKFLDQHVLNYTNREYRFMEDFRSQQFRPEDLFSTGDIAARLRDTHYYREIMGMVAPLGKSLRTISTKRRK